MKTCTIRQAFAIKQALQVLLKYYDHRSYRAWFIRGNIARIDNALSNR